MPIIRDSVLADASLTFAPKAAASEVFGLAEEGYLSIRLYRYPISGVEITRSARRADGLAPETAYLLKALFGARDTAGKTVVLTKKEQIPVAQSIAKLARKQLLVGGFIKPLEPHVLRRRLLAIFWAAMLGGSAIVIAVAHRPAAWVACGVVTALAWTAFSSAITDPLKRRGVLRTAKSKPQFTMLKALRFSCSYRGAGPVNGPSKPLAYELMWTRYGVPYSIGAGYYDQKPSWCEGPWPITRDKIAEALQKTHTAIADALNQEYVKNRGFRRPEEDDMLYDVLRGLYEDLSEDADAMRDASNTGDGGHDGGGHGGHDTGGDGGYDSDSGGGGDGHGGDGGDGGGGDGGGGDGGHG